MFAKLSLLLQICKMSSTALFAPRAKKARTKGPSKAKRRRTQKPPQEPTSQAGPVPTQAAAALLAAVAAATPLPQHGQPNQVQATVAS